MCFTWAFLRSASLAVFKTEEELQEILNRKEAQLKEKDVRRKKQAQNVALKKEKREQHKYAILIVVTLSVS